MTEWQPIGTAPKDRFILLYCEEDDSRWLAMWQGGRWYGVDDEGLTREGASAGDPDVVTGWFLNAWAELPEKPRPDTAAMTDTYDTEMSRQHGPDLLRER